MQYIHILTYLLTHENELKKMKKKNLPCNRFSVSQNFCNSWKYLSKMYTFDIPLPNCWFCEFVAVVDITLFLCVIFTSFFQRRRPGLVFNFTSFYFICLFFFNFSLIIFTSFFSTVVVLEQHEQNTLWLSAGSHTNWEVAGRESLVVAGRAGIIAAAGQSFLP